MSLTLAAALRRPSLAEADPIVRTGAGALDRRVRWIHSTEVIEIAPLLRGGELLLTGGEMLAKASPFEQRRYVRELAERQVAAVAIETGPHLPVIPAALLEEADAMGFPVVELRRVVPFVGVAESLNAELVNDSVKRLEYGGDLARALSAILGDGGDVQALLDELRVRTGASVVLFDRAGDPIAQTSEAAWEGSPTLTGAVTSRIAVRGTPTATLAFYPGPDADLDLLAIAGERAGEALALALLRVRPPSARDFAASELARLAARSDEHRGRIDRLGEIIGFARNAPALGIAIGGSTISGLHGLDGLLWRHGSVAIDTAASQARVVLSIRQLPQAGEIRARLIADLEEWARHQSDLVVAVGPLVPSLRLLSASMGAAESCLERRATRGPGVVVDASATMAVDWLCSDALRTQAQRLVQGQLAMLLAAPRAERDVLLDTLEAYLDHGCHKTRTAQALHLQRQSLYGRLERVFRLLGGDPTGTDRALALHLALKLRHALRLGGEPA
ncbi:PucR family transcriptional regulator ligand-binding domain-containing protein [Nocardioides sp. DS6]|uniref:PucR family transcriptional regulator ligand-binding domain-containing protein n=1 Tax=Nocardioides eburneus TaxID=3231482 RepID=A0ABV3SWQ1_9ACTN